VLISQTICAQSANYFPREKPIFINKTRNDKKKVERIVKFFIRVHLTNIYRVWWWWWTNITHKTWKSGVFMNGNEIKNNTLWMWCATIAESLAFIGWEMGNTVEVGQFATNWRLFAQWLIVSDTSVGCKLGNVWNSDCEDSYATKVKRIYIFQTISKKTKRCKIFLTFFVSAERFRGIFRWKFFVRTYITEKFSSRSFQDFEDSRFQGIIFKRLRFQVLGFKELRLWGFKFSGFRGFFRINVSGLWDFLVLWDQVFMVKVFGVSRFKGIKGLMFQSFEVSWNCEIKILSFLGINVSSFQCVSGLWFRDLRILRFLVIKVLR
jgi:hypothetical protein